MTSGLLCKNLTGHYWDLGGFENLQTEGIYGKRSMPHLGMAFRVRPGPRDNRTLTATRYDSPVRGAAALARKGFFVH